MKKMLLGFLCVLMMLSLCVVTCLGDDRRFVIDSYVVRVLIREDGSAEVEEHVSYGFTGSFNGVLMDIDYQGFGDFTDFEVWEYRKADELRQFSHADTQAQGTYTVSFEDGMARFKVYQPNRDDKDTFVYRYTLTEGVTRYEDTAQFNRKLIVAENWDGPIRSARAEISFEHPAVANELKIFAHGPLTGVSEITDDGRLVLEAGAIPSDSMLEAHALFPTAYVPGAAVTPVEKLDELMAMEGKLAEEANREREQAASAIKRQSLIRSLTFLPSLAAWVLSMLFLYFKYDKEYAVTFKEAYYRELPADYTPAEMSYLVNMQSVQVRDIMATLLHLKLKGFLDIEPFIYQDKGLLRTKDVEDYRITLTKKKKKDGTGGLKQHERFLIEWFIGSLAGGGSLALSELKKINKSRSKAVKFSADYEKWQAYAEVEGGNHMFFEDSGRVRLTAVLLGVGFIALAVLLYTVTQSLAFIVLGAMGVITIVYGAFIKKRSVHGQEHYEKWMAFKRFLKDFSAMDKASVGSVVLWEHYLVYAVSLGVAKEVIDKLPTVFSEEDFNDPNLVIISMYRRSRFGYGSFDHMINTTSKTIESTVQTARSIANSQQSSSSGSGGGFSGGSSGGGGGRSGGGAF